MMTTGAPVTPPAGALLVRVRLTAQDLATDAGEPVSWVRGLPAVPGGRTVTVTVSDDRLREVPADDLISRGYRIVGVRAPTPRSRGACLDLLITAELLAAHPEWAARVRDRAERAFDLSMGPVQRVLGDVIALHLGSGDPTR